MLQQCKRGPLCHAWQNQQPEEDLLRASNTSCFLLSLGKETSSALPAYERYVCGYFNRGVHKNVVLQLPVNITAGIPWKIQPLCSCEIDCTQEKTLILLEKIPPVCLKSQIHQHNCFLNINRTTRGVRRVALVLQHLALP